MTRKLTIINQQYPPEVAATGQIFARMAAYMRAHGFDVTVVTGTPYYPGLTERPPRREIMDGVLVKRIFNTTFAKQKLLGKLMNLLTFEISLLFHAIFCIGRDQTVLVATAPPMAVLCTAVGRFFRRYRVVMTVQDLYPDVLAASGMQREDKWSYRLLKSLMRASMHATDGMIAISTDMQRHLMDAYGVEEAAVIPNLFPETIAPVNVDEAKARKGFAGKMVVQYSGNFGVAHEWETLFGAAKALRGEADILFQIAGSGSNYTRLQEACRAEGLSNVVFEGYAPLAEMAWHLGAADVSVVVFSEAFESILLPSKYYGILASGRGVLLISGAGSDIRRDIEETGCGLCFGHGASQALVQALRALRDDPARRKEMGRRARALYDARYTQDIILGAYERYLKQEETEAL